MNKDFQEIFLADASAGARIRPRDIKIAQIVGLFLFCLVDSHSLASLAPVACYASSLHAAASTVGSRPSGARFAVPSFLSGNANRCARPRFLCRPLSLSLAFSLAQTWHDIRKLMSYHSQRSHTRVWLSFGRGESSVSLAAPAPSPLPSKLSLARYARSCRLLTQALSMRRQD